MRRSRYVAQAGTIAAVYAALTLVALQFPYQLGWGLVQFRLSEAVTVLALFSPAAIPGLMLGTAAANAWLIAIVGPVALLDVVFGSLGSLLGALWMWRFRERTALALAGPVISNALLVPLYLPIMIRGLGLYEIPLLGIDVEGQLALMYLLGVVAVGLGQALVVYGLGWPLATALRRSGLAAMLDT